MEISQSEQQNTTHVTKMWGNVLSRLKFLHGEATYNSWFKSLSLAEISGSQVLLNAPSRFIKEWIKNNYLDDIQSCIRTEYPQVTFVDVAVNKVFASNREENNQPTNNYVEPESVNNFYIDEVKPNPAYNFDNFVIGASNQMAYMTAKSIAKGRSELLPSANTMFLHAKTGLGKTHLMYAIANEVKKNNPQSKVAYLSAEKFMYYFVKALRAGEIVSFKEYFRSLDLLLVDDIQFICGKASTQDEFFHTFNSLLDNSCRIVVSSNKRPSELEGLSDGLISRLSGGIRADITNGDYNLRLDILRMKYSQIKNTQDILNVSQNISDEVINMLASKITNNNRELEGALVKLVVHSQIAEMDIDINCANSVLGDNYCSNKQVDIESIQNIVCEEYGISNKMLLSNKRTKDVVLPRHIAIYLSKKLTTHSLPEIGVQFGGRDHTTVIHAIKRIKKLMSESEELTYKIEQIEANIC